MYLTTGVSAACRWYGLTTQSRRPVSYYMWFSSIYYRTNSTASHGIVRSHRLHIIHATNDVGHPCGEGPVITNWRTFANSGSQFHRIPFISAFSNVSFLTNAVIIYQGQWSYTPLIWLDLHCSSVCLFRATGRKFGPTDLKCSAFCELEPPFRRWVKTLDTAITVGIRHCRIDRRRECWSG